MFIIPLFWCWCCCCNFFFFVVVVVAVIVVVVARNYWIECGPICASSPARLPQISSPLSRELLTALTQPAGKSSPLQVRLWGTGSVCAYSLCPGWLFGGCIDFNAPNSHVRRSPGVGP